jgi:hypothetical protein
VNLDESRSDSTGIRVGRSTPDTRHYTEERERTTRNWVASGNA